MKKKRAWINFHSIQSTIFLSISVMVLFAVIVVTAVSMGYTKNAIFDNSTMYTRTIIEQMNQNIDSYINYMGNITDTVLDNSDVQTFLFSEGKEKEEAEGRLQHLFATILSSREDIGNVGIISLDGQFLMDDGSKQMNPDLDIKSQKWFMLALESPEENVITSSHVQHVVKGERPWVITLCRGIQNETTGEKEGVFFIDLNYSAIRELCEQNNFGEKGYVYILNEDGNIVYHPQQQQLYNELQTENIELILSSDEEIVMDAGHNKLYTISRSEETGWTVVGSVNMDELLRGNRQASGVYILSAVALVIIGLFLSNRISKTITSPIQRLRDSMAKVQEGDFDAAEVEVEAENETGSLTISFNVMTRRIRELMEQNARDQEEKRKSELKALQSQINPHFLYNTLDSIIWMAEGGKNEEVVLMTSSLARLLRQTITNEEELVSLEQEIECARSYLTIQKMRYKDKLEYQIDLEPTIRTVPIIKLVLQPLIENAIYHGLKYKEGKGKLVIRGYQSQDNVVIEIVDNGAGMEKETLEHIFEKHKVNYRSNGVGVYNVQKRLQIYYGKNYGIDYQSEPGEGTMATITIPYITEEAER